MKRVSFEVAKYLKEIGYPQAETDEVYRNDGCLDSYSKWIGGVTDVCCDAPTYLEVWLWLWREKGIYISVERIFTTEGVRVSCSVSYGVNIYRLKYRLNPEEAIIASIEYLVTNKLIK